MKFLQLAGLLISLAALSGVALSATLSVQVADIKSEKGQIGCSLHSTDDTFPMGTVATQLWQPAQKGSLSCVFTDLTPGFYAVAVSHDLNANGKTDTNFLGIPKEDWGVSNNVRPAMRAPTFDEAKIELAESVTIQINLD